MMKKNEMPIVILIVILAATVMYFSGMGCPILKMTGIPCFGCGMTRAVICLVHLDMTGALYYHPMVFFMPACIIALLFSKRMPKTLVKGILIGIVGLFIFVYVVRLFDTENEIVKWQMENGMLYKFFAK